MPSRREDHKMCDRWRVAATTSRGRRLESLVLVVRAGRRQETPTGPRQQGNPVRVRDCPATVSGQPPQVRGPATGACTAGARCPRPRGWVAGRDGSVPGRCCRSRRAPARVVPGFRTLVESTPVTLASSTAASASPSSGIAADQPIELTVIRRDGSSTPFDATNISVAVTKAFLAVEGADAGATHRVRDLVTDLTGRVVGALTSRGDSRRSVQVEDIQDQVELALMRAG